MQPAFSRWDRHGTYQRPYVPEAVSVLEKSSQNQGHRIVAHHHESDLFRRDVLPRLEKAMCHFVLQIFARPSHPVHIFIYTTIPSALCCLGSPAASKTPPSSNLNPCAELCPGATHVTLCPLAFINATVELSYAYSKDTWFGTN